MTTKEIDKIIDKFCHENFFRKTQYIEFADCADCEEYEKKTGIKHVTTLDDVLKGFLKFYLSEKHE